MKFEKYDIRVTAHIDTNKLDAKGRPTMVVHFFKRADFTVNRFLPSDYSISNKWIHTRSYGNIAMFKESEGSINDLMNLVCDCISSDGVDYELFLKNVIHPSEGRHLKMRQEVREKSIDWKTKYEELIEDNVILSQQLCSNIGVTQGVTQDETGQLHGLAVHSFDLNKPEDELVLEFIKHIDAERKRHNRNHEAIKNLLNGI